MADNGPPREDALNYAEAILATVREPLLVLDGKLRVRTANRSFYRTFRVRPEQTEGRLLYELGNGQWDVPALRKLLGEILPRNSAFDDFEVEHDFPGIGKKVMLLNARKLHREGNHAELILLAIEDVTALRGAEEERRHLETRFTEMVKNVKDHSIFLTDPEGVITSWNVAAERVIGYTEAEAVGRHFSLIFTPEDVEAGVPARELRQAGEKGRAEDERWHVRKDGTLFWAFGVVSPLHDPGGRLVGFSKVLRDVTERKRAEEALRESERRLRTVSDNLPRGAVYQGIGDLDGHRRLLYVSAGVERLFGVTPEEAIADPQCLYRLVHAEDAARVRAVEERAFRELAPFDCEFRSRTRSGATIWIHARSAPRPLPTGQVVWEGIILDITDRKEAEQALHGERELLGAIIDRIPVMLTVYEPGARILRLNPAFERTLGWSARDAAGVSLMEQCFPDPDYRKEVLEFMRSCRDGWMDLRMRTRDGRDLETSWANVRLSNGTQVGIGLDISERKRYEESLREADRRKDEFLAMLGHELRNPLAPIRNAAQVIRLLGPSDPNVVRSTELIERQVQHMSRLVEDLLDVSRITRGKITLRLEPVRLAGVVARAVEAARPLIDARKHELSVTLPPEALYVNADATRLAQVVGNLLTNAAKYTEEGGRIELAVGREGNTAAVRVRDNGLGIPREMLAPVFELFTQVDRSVARSEGGLGIGLTLVKNLVELHGGTVEAHSEGPGRGSEFVVRLPLLPAPRAADEEGRAGERPAPPRRVLVVDDNADAAETLALLLRIERHEVRTAPDGPTALRLAEDFRPEVVLLDIGLPRMDGYEVARRLRTQPAMAKAVLVALTGYGQEEDRRRSGEAGFDAHLTKPAEPATLRRLLASATATAAQPRGTP